MIGAWIRWCAARLPSDERERWTEEWLAEYGELRRRGEGWWRRLEWAAGVGLASGRIGMEGVWMKGWIREIRLALRALARRPGFAAVAIGTLALGIGSTTALVSTVRGVLLEPLAFPDSDQLVLVHTSFPSMGFDEFWMSPPEFAELSERSGSVFTSLGGFRALNRSVGGGEQPERVVAAAATASLFETLRVTPAIGRVYTAEEDVDGGPSLAVLSWELFERSFGGDRSTVGRTIEVNGMPAEVVGVMPPGFDLDDEGIQLWLPAQLDPDRPGQRASHWLRVVGRMRPGLEPGDARREVQNLVARWEEDTPIDGHLPHPEFHPFLIEGLQDDLVGEVRTALWVLLGAVGFVLLIACANVANLLLARAEDRQREVSIRAALGAGRGRLLRQFLIEGLVLAGIGSLFGIALAAGGLTFLRAVGSGELPRLAEIDLDWTVLAVTTLMTAGVGLFFGVAPARHALASSSPGLRESTRTTGSRARKGVRSALVVVQTALALVLAVGAGLMLRSFGSLTSVDPGFDAQETLTFQLYLPDNRYATNEEALTALNRMREALEARPEFERVVMTTELPTEQVLYANDLEFETLERGPDDPPHNVDYVSTITTDYDDVMGLRLVAGRALGEGDLAGANPVVMINETFARTYFKDASPLGQRVRTCCDDGPFYEIVGVVEDVKQEGLARPAGTELFFSIDQVPDRSVTMMVRTRPGATEAAAAARAAIGGIDGSLPLARLRTIEEVMGEARARSRFLSALLAGFAAVALFLAAVGTYGVMSYSVSQRSRELGIRMAIGADAGRVRWVVLYEGLGIAMIGVVAGLAGAWFLTGVLDSLLFGVEARDPMAFVLGPLALSLVAAAACWLPARRATRVDPVTVLRQE